MPYPNEHAAWVKDPDNFEQSSFRRKEIAPGVQMVMGKMKGSDSMEAQAYRFDKNKFSAGEARKWLEEHVIKHMGFEPAMMEHSADEETIDFSDVMTDNTIHFAQDIEPGERLLKRGRVLYTGTHKGKTYGKAELKKIVESFPGGEGIPVHIYLAESFPANSRSLSSRKNTVQNDKINVKKY